MTTTSILCRPWIPADKPVAVVIDTHKDDTDRHPNISPDAPVVWVLEIDTERGVAYVEDDVFGGWVPIYCLYRPVSDDPWPPDLELGKETD